MRYVCGVALDYLGVLDEECDAPPDNPVSEECKRSYYRQKESDPDHPSVLLKVCGNCLYWVVCE